MTELAARAADPEAARPDEAEASVTPATTDPAQTNAEAEIEAPATPAIPGQSTAPAKSPAPAAVTAPEAAAGASASGAATASTGAAVSAPGAAAPRAIPVPRTWIAVAMYAVSLVALWLSPMGHHWNFVDIGVYRQGGLAVLHDSGLYDPSFNHHALPFTYPPISALVFTGLGLMSDYISQIFATVCTLVLLPLALRFALRLRPFSGWLTASQATRLALAAAAAGVWFEPMWTTLRYGQINVLISALILFDLSRSDDRRWKGAAIGIAAGLKMTPLIFIVYLAATRRYRAAATALGGFVGTIALSFAIIPGDARIYWTQDVLNSNRPGRVENAANQTLRGALSRLLHTENVQTPWLCAALIVAGVGVFLAVQAQRRGGNEAGGFALCAITGLLVSPISWTHHWVEAIPALMLVLLKAYRDRSTPLLIACIVAAVIGYSQITWRVPLSDFYGHVELHEHGRQLVFSNAYVLAALVALGWAGVAACRSRRPADVAAAAAKA